MTTWWRIAGLAALTLALGACDDGGGGGDKAPADMAVAGDGGAQDGGDGAAPDMDPNCNPGTEGCRCLMDGTCRVDGLACVSGTCVDEASDCDPAVERCPPANPVCYTPCRGDIFAPDGTLRICSAEGLMAGCLAGSVCNRGSCVPEVGNKDGHAPGTCDAETQCPDFQTCIRGRCYSDCESDQACGDDATCFRHVCRDQCAVGKPCQASGYACQDGVCLPLARSGEPTPVGAPQAFALDRATLSFTSGTTEGMFRIANLGSAPLQVTVSKDEQRTVEDGREVVITDQPLRWIDMGVGQAEAVQDFEVSIAPGMAAEIQVAGAKAEGRARWEGRLRVEAQGLGARFLRLEYSEETAGRYVGTAYAFGVFPDGARPAAGDFPLDDWIADRRNTALLDDVPNAFMQAWGRFRSGEIGLPEMAAIIDATLTGSWDFPRVRELCRAEGGGANTICAPFGGTGSRSVITYTSTAQVNNTPTVPAGVVELDFALNLRNPTAAERAQHCGGAPHCVVGRIDSATAIQYAGNPQVAITFDEDPVACSQRGVGGCTASVRSLDAQIGVGARYQPADASPAACGNGFTESALPWLVPGFAPLSGDGERVDCLDRRFPGGPGARANPIPDGAPRLRQLELVDGVLIEQHVMTLILRESVDPFHGGEPFSTYMYVVLERSDVPLAPGEADGNPVPAVAPAPVTLGPVCDAGLMQQVLGAAGPVAALSPANAAKLANAVAGGADGAALTPLDPDRERVHSLCVWEEDAVAGGNIDVGGEAATVRREIIDAGPGGDRPCFPGATVIYFALPDGANPARWDCNAARPETCLDELVRRVERGDDIRLRAEDAPFFPNAGPDVEFNLIYQCTAPGAVSCSDNRYDLTQGKVFGVADGRRTYFTPLATQIAEAFRYKTRFVDRVTGAQIGFAPTICRGDGRFTPYCYDPPAVEALRDRMDCVMALYDAALKGQIELNGAPRTALRQALDAAFSQLDAGDDDVAVLSHGFERLYAELQIMLGDDAYTAAFASRFDLAGAASLAFEGSLFEAGGVDLSGAAGYELFKLHQAAQYYDLVLERFFEMSVMLWDSTSANGGDRYLSSKMVTSYLDRVIRASTRSAAAWSEIAARYQTLNQSELARTVLTRATTRAWQESLVLREFMNQIIKIVNSAEQPQVFAAINEAQIRYRVALLDMKARFQQIGARIDPFGLPPGFIPFPALDEDDVNGFEVVLERAMARLELAEADEEAAIAARRDFDTDQASFQSELVTIRNGYEAELGAICGTFLAEDGRVYPAIARYADKDPVLATLDDPCGAAGNGSLWFAGGNLQGTELELQRVRQEAANIQGAMADAQAQVAVQCGMIAEDVGAFLVAQGILQGLERDNDRMGSAITQLDKVHDIVAELTARVADIADAETPWGQALKGVQIVGFGISAGVNLIATSALEIAINVNQERIREVEAAYEARAIGRECDYLQADLVYTLRDLHREQLLIELDILNAVWNTQVEFSNIQALVNERNRLEAEWRDTEQLTINVAAAQNDPNIRIFKNDAILNADRSFSRAAREAWKTTRMYEYYTASSYAEREKLFLVRMARAGDINLRRYLQDLEDAFFDFEQEFGNPDTRVALISLRDDVLDIDRYAPGGGIQSSDERAAAFRRALQDPALLNDEGALAVRFSTTFDVLSPLTVNHKILFVEVGIYGQHDGDLVGRVYLKQQGTGVVEGTDATRRFFTFPARTAVMNPFFNDDEERFGQDADGAIAGPTRTIYRSYRFRERPFVQTDWEFVLDQRGEVVNRDINLNGLDDIVIRIYYTDFTQD